LEYVADIFPCHVTAGKTMKLGMNHGTQFFQSGRIALLPGF
jgi:hypothetical protein